MSSKVTDDMPAERVYVLAGELRGTIVILSGGNRTAWHAPVRPIDDGGEEWPEPEPEPVCDFVMRYAETGKSKLSAGGKTLSGICTCGKGYWRDSTLVRNPRVDGRPFDRFLKSWRYVRTGLWGRSGERVAVRPIGEGQPLPDSVMPTAEAIEETRELADERGFPMTRLGVGRRPQVRMRRWSPIAPCKGCPPDYGRDVKAAGGVR
ncbi:hypothetical protein [Streptomyces sp. NPDC050585]|uniref:hypothetical protein n=1 Tax=Streptomyces sp. NPDC050585 TaxID=3365632 RepID=UPI0037A358F9